MSHPVLGFPPNLDRDMKIFFKHDLFQPKSQANMFYKILKKIWQLLPKNMDRQPNLKRDENYTSIYIFFRLKLTSSLTTHSSKLVQSLNQSLYPNLSQTILSVVNNALEFSKVPNFYSKQRGDNNFMSKLDGYSQNLLKLPKILPNTYQSSLNSNEQHPNDLLTSKSSIQHHELFNSSTKIKWVLKTQTIKLEILHKFVLNTQFRTF